MNFALDLKQALANKPEVVWKLRPEVLLLPQIPKPMHGLAPRVVLGTKWWDETRQACYKSTDYHCVACGVHKTQARGPKWLEAHERYRTDYKVCRLYYLEAVPLCHFCHNYIHQGRLQALLEKHQITQHKFVQIMQHGERVLVKAGLLRPEHQEIDLAQWSKWRLVLFGKMYKPKFKTFQAWAKHFNVEIDEDA